MKLITVFENEHFIVVDKPAMVLTTPSREGATDERPCLGIFLQDSLGIQIFPVHRLDYEVSGLVIFAKNAKAHAIANSWFENKSVFKIYQALTGSQNFDHIPANVKNDRKKIELKLNEKFHWKTLLLRGKKRSYAHPTGKLSETLAYYQGKASDSSWHRWELHPVTGRPHQLRYELSHHGFPIVGDVLYGSQESFSKPGIALRAMKIDFSQTPGRQELGLPLSLEVATPLLD